MNKHQVELDNVTIGASARFILDVPREEADKVLIEHWGYRTESGNGNTRFISELKHNALVNQGLQKLLDSWYSALTASRITHIGLSADTSAVTASTTSLDPGTAGSSIKTIANVSRTAQTVSGDATWTQADVSWVITKIGLLVGSGVGDVVSIIGGTGGSSPYNENFQLDLTSVTTFNLQMGVDLTATAT